MEHAKQGIVETIIQINRVRTLLAYGPLLVEPAETGESQTACAAAHALKLPWTILDMNFINDPEQLTGSPRIHADAKSGTIMEAFSMTRGSSLVFIINELDRIVTGKGNGDPVGVPLTLLDNPGLTDNYIKCIIPTVDVYPIVTANDKTQISAPLVSCFAITDIPDYTQEEKKIAFLQYAPPEVLRRMSMNTDECIVTEEVPCAITEKHSNTIGTRDLEQAVERITANTLYQIRVNHVLQATFSAEMARKLLE